MNIAPTYFADASFWIALLEQGDQHHTRAILWQQHILTTHAFLITTEAVLWEMLNYCAIPAARTRALRLYQGARNRSEIGVEPFDPTLIESALRLYESRPDKSWGITDCLSFETMRLRGLTQALTADRHFTQAGFQALLLSDPLPIANTS